MHHTKVSNNYDWLPHNNQDASSADTTITTPEEYQNMAIQPLGDRQAFHDRFMQGCKNMYKGDLCQMNEDQRVEMSLRQPQSVYNYTKLGFTKLRAPEHVFQLIQEFWDKNKDKGKPESWSKANIYTNVRIYIYMCV